MTCSVYTIRQDMTTYRVVKRVFFSYGHRLLDYAGKCAHLHGHNAKVEVVLAARDLDARGMLWDFGEIAGRLEGFVKEHLDHRMLLRRDDPLVSLLSSAGEPVVPLDFNPTAENLARFLFEAARDHGLPVVSIRFWESPNSCAEYTSEGPAPSSP
ncbi:MAG TPA: 6-carboxytetrahydropterin synthase [Acidobacteriota bacterium]|nr:6-carboxytetrahydropterin synthase [Acidobacteriota bacterium]HRV07337.1 6-carboxytetrahydropterin synthase [Acidobacteriota bacterium]